MLQDYYHLHLLDVVCSSTFKFVKFWHAEWLSMTTWYRSKISYHKIPPKLHTSFNNSKNTRYKVLPQTKQNLENANLVLIPHKRKTTSLTSNENTHNSEVLITFEKYYYKHMSLSVWIAKSMTDPNGGTRTAFSN